MRWNALKLSSRVPQTRQFDLFSDGIEHQHHTNWRDYNWFGTSPHFAPDHPPASWSKKSFRQPNCSLIFVPKSIPSLTVCRSFVVQICCSRNAKLKVLFLFLNLAIKFYCLHADRSIRRLPAAQHLSHMLLSIWNLGQITYSMATVAGCTEMH